jgi:hypothetical protein
MGALTDLWKSERGLIASLLIIAATVLAALGKVTFAEWREYTLYVFGTYAVLKTITGTTAIIKGTTDPAPVETHAEGARMFAAGTSPAPIPAEPAPEAKS